MESSAGGAEWAELVLRLEKDEMPERGPDNLQLIVANGEPLLANAAQIAAASALIRQQLVSSPLPPIAQLTRLDLRRLPDVSRNSLSALLSLLAGSSLRLTLTELIALLAACASLLVPVVIRAAERLLHDLAARGNLVYVANAAVQLPAISSGTRDTILAIASPTLLALAQQTSRLRELSGPALLALAQRPDWRGRPVQTLAIVLSWLKDNADQTGTAAAELLRAINWNRMKLDERRAAWRNIHRSHQAIAPLAATHLIAAISLPQPASNVTASSLALSVRSSLSSVSLSRSDVAQSDPSVFTSHPSYYHSSHYDSSNCDSSPYDSSHYDSSHNDTTHHAYTSACYSAQ